jgi:hypothetical protein
MRRAAVFALFSLCSCALCSFAQSSSPAVSDSEAILLAKTSIAALTGGLSISDVTLNASVTSIVGPDSATGTATFQAKGISEARVDLTLPSGTISDTRNISNGLPGGAWQKKGLNVTPYALHNSWTDAAWFFPALSSLSQTSNSHYIFNYVGLEQRGGISTQHLLIYQVFPQDTGNAWNIPRVSAMEFFLDASSFLPLAITFNTHPDDDMGTVIPVEIRFANYRTVSGVQVPTHLQQILNGTLRLDVSITDTVVNSNLADTVFSLQ